MSLSVSLIHDHPITQKCPQSEFQICSYISGNKRKCIFYVNVIVFFGRWLSELYGVIGLVVCGTLPRCAVKFRSPSWNEAVCLQNKVSVLKKNIGLLFEKFSSVNGIYSEAIKLIIYSSKSLISLCYFSFFIFIEKPYKVPDYWYSIIIVQHYSYLFLFVQSLCIHTIDLSTVFHVWLILYLIINLCCSCRCGLPHCNWCRYCSWNYIA